MFWTKKASNHAVPVSTREALGHAFNEHELTVLARNGTLIDLPAGTELTHQGTYGRQALIVSSGTASVIRDNNVIAAVGPGDVVGELALLTGERRTATVVADGPVNVYALSPREFASLLDQCPRLAQRVTTDAVRRVGQLATA